MLSLFDDEIFVHARMLSLGVWFFFADWRIQCAFNIKTTLIQVRHTGRCNWYVQQLFFYI